MRNRLTWIAVMLLALLPSPATGIPPDVPARESVFGPPRHKLDPPETFNMIFTDGAGGYGLTGGRIGPGDIYNIWPGGQFTLRLAEGHAYFAVCPAGREPDCGTAAPGAAPFLIGWGTLTARGQGLQGGGGWCSGSARGRAILEDENGDLYDFQFIEVRFRNREGRGCRTVHGSITATPIP